MGSLIGLGHYIVWITDPLAERAGHTGHRTGRPTLLVELSGVAGEGP